MTDKNKRTERGGILRNDPITATGTLVSILISVALVVFDVATAIEGFIIGTLLTLLSLTVQLVYESRVRSELDEALRRAGWLRNRVTNLAETTSELVSQYAETEIAVEAEAKFTELEREIEELRRGTIVRPGDDFSDLIGATADAHQSIHAITNISRHDDDDAEAWWRGSVGRRYWQTNLDAIARHVRITRIFIFAEMTDSLERLVRSQAEAGIDVHLLESSHIEPSKHVNITIWDNEKAWEAKMNARGAIVKNMFHLNRHDVYRLQQDFQTCLTYSTPLAVENEPVIDGRSGAEQPEPAG